MTRSVDLRCSDRGAGELLAARRIGERRDLADRARIRRLVPCDLKLLSSFCLTERHLPCSLRNCECELERPFCKQLDTPADAIRFLIGDSSDGPSTSRLGSVCLLIVCSARCSRATGGCKQGPWPLWNSYSARFIDPQRAASSIPAATSAPPPKARPTRCSLPWPTMTAPPSTACWPGPRPISPAAILQTHLPAWLWGKNKDGAVEDPRPQLRLRRRRLDRLYASRGRPPLEVPAYTQPGPRHAGPDRQKRSRRSARLRSHAAARPRGFQHGNNWTLNPSYLPLFLFERLAAVDPAGPWQQIALSIPRLLEQSARHGYAMDWVEYVPGDGFYPAPKPQRRRAGRPERRRPGGSYDAIRVYLWAGMIDPRRSPRAPDPQCRSRHERLPCQS